MRACRDHASAVMFLAVSVANPWSCAGYNHGGGCACLAWSCKPARLCSFLHSLRSIRPRILLWIAVGRRVQRDLADGVVWLLAASTAWVAADQYRLCPANKPLTEECMQAMPLEFDTEAGTSLVWNNGTRYNFKNVFVSTGTWPKGSTWAREKPHSHACC